MLLPKAELTLSSAFENRYRAVKARPMLRQVLLVTSTMNALKFDLPPFVRKKIGPKAGLSRAVGTGLPRKAAAEPGLLTLESVKRSRPAEPAYCNAATVFGPISFSR